MATPTQLLAKQDSEFVRDFIGTDRIERKRDFSKKLLVELRSFFTKDWAGPVLHVAANTQVKKAVSLLEKHPESRLEVMQDGIIIGYVGSSNLLQAAINAKDGGK